MNRHCQLDEMRLDIGNVREEDERARRRTIRIYKDETLSWGTSRQDINVLNIKDETVTG